MRNSQTLEIRSVEIRGKLAELSGIEETLTDEQRTELKDKTLELRDVESQRIAALEVEGLADLKLPEGGIVDAELRERNSILDRSLLGNAIKAVIDGRPLQGAEAELRSAYGLTGDHEIPHEMFEPNTEKRAVTGAPGTKPINESPVQPFIYKDGIAGFLGIDMPNAGSGVHSFPVLTTGTPAGMKAKGGTADETAAAFTVASSSPKRVTGSFRVRVEDMAVFPQLETSLRRDIPQSLANAVSDQLLNGDGSSPNINGILERLTDLTPQAQKNVPSTYVLNITSELDGVHGTNIKDLRALVGKQTYAAMAGGFFDSTAISIASYLDLALGGVMMSDRIPVVAANVQSGIVRVELRPFCAVAAVWGGVSLIRDIYSSAASGEIVVTALQLISDLHVLRAGSFAEVSFYP